MSNPPAPTAYNTQDTPIYNDDVVKLFSLATMFWGVVGFTVGLLIALQLAFPGLNFEPFLTFGRLRPVHTSGVVFAFGGSALICHQLLCGATHLPCASLA
jgi:cytochrome c oxidase cbb3-type subunit 1